MTSRSIDSNKRRALGGQREFDREEFILRALVGVLGAGSVIVSASFTHRMRVSGTSLAYARRMRQRNEAIPAVPLHPDQPHGPPRRPEGCRLFSLLVTPVQQTVTT